MSNESEYSYSYVSQLLYDKWLNGDLKEVINKILSYDTPEAVCLAIWFYSSLGDSLLKTQFMRVLSERALKNIEY